MARVTIKTCRVIEAAKRISEQAKADCTSYRGKCMEELLLELITDGMWFWKVTRCRTQAEATFKYTNGYDMGKRDADYGWLYPKIDVERKFLDRSFRADRLRKAALESDYGTMDLDEGEVAFLGLNKGQGL